MDKGQRVEIINGVLEGEKATVKDVGTHQNGWEGFVWLHFDNHNKTYGPEKGYANLSEQWFEIARLRNI